MSVAAIQIIAPVVTLNQPATTKMKLKNTECCISPIPNQFKNNFQVQGKKKLRPPSSQLTATTRRLLAIKR